MVTAAIEDLLARPPVLHGTITHGLTEDALHWIAAQPRPLRTLETGCGLSTLVFALRGDRHLCITQDGEETDRVREYLDDHGVEAGGLAFEVARSEVALPSLTPGPLDLVLIDGSHAFPNVFVDWLYATPHLRVGGTLVVDDVHLWTGKVLRDYLVEAPEWELITEWGGRTAAFRKRTEATYRDWFDQPFVHKRSTPTRTRLRMSVSLLRRGDVATLRRLAGDLVRRGRF
jgi:predicted O-methyltransferase YrrM